MFLEARFWGLFASACCSAGFLSIFFWAGFHWGWRSWCFCTWFEGGGCVIVGAARLVSEVAFLGFVHKCMFQCGFLRFCSGRGFIGGWGSWCFCTSVKSWCCTVLGRGSRRFSSDVVQTGWGGGVAVFLEVIQKLVLHLFTMSQWRGLAGFALVLDVFSAGWGS